MEPIPPIIPINNCQVLIKRRKKANRNAIIIIITCLITPVVVVWWVYPGIALDIDSKLNAIRPAKRKILNRVDDNLGSNDWKLKKWGEPISTDYLQVKYKEYVDEPFISRDGGHYRVSHDPYRWKWRDCTPGRTMYPLIIEGHIPALGWREHGYCAFITRTDGKATIMNTDHVRKRDKPGWYFMNGE